MDVSRFVFSVCLFFFRAVARYLITIVALVHISVFSSLLHTHVDAGRRIVNELISRIMLVHFFCLLHGINKPRSKLTGGLVIHARA